LKGFNAGDLVGDLPDPSMYAEANKLDAAGGKGGTNLPGKADRAGAGLGLYRAGGPTTIFGGSGWGPYSDGPLNAVRKSLLNRDGLNEENWMHIAAQRTAEAAEAFSKIRKEALQVCGGVQDRGGLPIDEDLKKREAEDGSDGGRRKKVRSIEDVLPLGLYEAHSGIVHCKLFSVSFVSCFKKKVNYPRCRSGRYSTNDEPLGSNAQFFGKASAGRNKIG
jgi:chromatin structure-remodeling complex protein RSC7